MAKKKPSLPNLTEMKREAAAVDGAADPGDELMRTSITLPRRTIAIMKDFKVERYRAGETVTVSEIIRRALDDYFERSRISGSFGAEADAPKARKRTATEAAMDNFDDDVKRNSAKRAKR